MSLNNPLESIQENDLVELIELKVSEGKAIEFKQALPDKGTYERVEFLADVSSFANAGGGHLILGMNEEKGIATEICGLGAIDADQEISRLENLIRDGLEPRLPAVHLRGVPTSHGVVIVARVGKSWISPHRVTFNRDFRFFGRHSNGKHAWDVGELRVAFGLSDTAAERIRRFRIDRVGKILAGESPVPMGVSAKSIFHLVPYGVGGDVDLGAEWLERSGGRAKPSPGAACESRFNLDGYLSFQTYPIRSAGQTDSYLQIFRDGAIERVGHEYFERAKDGQKRLDSRLQHLFFYLVPGLLRMQKDLGVELPVLFFVTLVGVEGYMYRPDQWNRYSIDRDVVPIPEVVIESFDMDPQMAEKTLRPVVDAVWQAAGFARSPHE